MAEAVEHVSGLDSKTVVDATNEARDVVEQLNRDAGYEPVYAGGLENAGSQESFLGLAFAINQGGLGPFVYRMAPPEEL